MDFILQATILTTLPDSLTGASFNAGVGWGQFIRVLLALALVLGLIWLTRALLKRLMSRRTDRQGVLSPVGGMSLGQRRALQLVQFADKVYLLGVTDHHISRIAEISDPEVIRSLTRHNSGRKGSLFHQLFSQTSGQSAAASGRDGDE